MAGCATEPSLNLKGRGDLAELMVATDLLRRGHKIAIPYGEDCDFDLVLIRANRLERVQVKHTRSDGSVVNVRCRSHSLRLRRHLGPLLLHQGDRAGHRSLNSLPAPHAGEEWTAGGHTACRALPRSLSESDV